MISVIIPTYNNEGSIKACIESVLAQKVELEIVVVNDGSTDKTREVVESIKSSRIRLVSKENEGSNPTRNRGFAESNGEFVIFLDADAVLVPDALTRLLAALEADSSAAYAYGDFKFGWKKFKTGPFDPARLRELNYIHTSALIRKETFPGFDPQIKRFQDWDLWLAMLSNSDIGAYVPGVLMTMKNDRLRASFKISSWLPKSWYRAPWRWLPGVKKRVEAYNKAKEIIRAKHDLH